MYIKCPSKMLCILNGMEFEGTALVAISCHLGKLSEELYLGKCNVWNQESYACWRTHVL